MLLVLVACERAPTPDWSWEGEHVTIHAYGYKPADTCGGTFQATDAHAGQIALWHGADPNELDINIHWVESTRFAGEEWCSSYAVGCTLNGEVHVERLPFGHELSHAVDYARGQAGTPVLNEGLAAIHSDPQLGGPPTPSYPVDPVEELAGDIRDALVVAPTPPDNWFSSVTAGHFVTYLIETHGLDAVHELQNRAAHDIAEPGWDALFREVLGESFDEVLAGYDAFPLCSWNEYRSKLWECGGQPDAIATPDMDTLTFEVDLSCNNFEAIGHSSKYVRVAHQLLVPDPGPDEWNDHGRHYRIDVRRPDSLALEFGVMLVEECGVPCSADPRVWSLPADAIPWDMLAYDLRPGTYALVFAGRGTYEVTIEPA
jgi:hypothetical protein